MSDSSYRLTALLSPRIVLYMEPESIYAMSSTDMYYQQVSSMESDTVSPGSSADNIHFST